MLKKISSYINFLNQKKTVFPSPKILKQELFHIKKTWYSMLKKISFYINILNQKKTVFPISEKFRTRTLP